MVQKKNKKKTLKPLYQHFWSSKWSKWSIWMDGRNVNKTKNKQKNEYSLYSKTTAKEPVCFSFFAQKLSYADIFFFVAEIIFIHNHHYFRWLVVLFFLEVIVAVFVVVVVNETTTTSFALHTFDQKKKKKNILLFWINSKVGKKNEEETLSFIVNKQKKCIKYILPMFTHTQHTHMPK